MENRFSEKEITTYLNANIDEKYREFHKKLLPNVSHFLGIRLPVEQYEDVQTAVYVR